MKTVAPRERRERDPELTREALKGAAREAFAREGFEGARTREIAARAGANKALISYHFGGKQGLFTAVLLEDVIAAKENFRQAMDSAGSPSAKLGSFMRAMADVARERPTFLPLLAQELMSAGRHLEPHVEEEFFGFFHLVRDTLREGIEAGEFRPVDPHATHISLIGGLVWFGLTEPLRERTAAEGRPPAPSATWPGYVEHMRQLVLRGLAPASERPGAAG
jgi:AcrR family transcriptional regulator